MRALHLLAIALLVAARCGVPGAAENAPRPADDRAAPVWGAEALADAVDAQADDAGMIDLEPLLVAPLWIYDDPKLGFMDAFMRVPKPAQRLLATAGVQLAMHDERSAAATLRQALELTERQRGADDPAVLFVLLRQAQLDESRRDWPAVVATHRRAQALAAQALGAQSPWLVSLQWREAAALLASGDLPAARAAGERAGAALQARGGSVLERLAAANNRAILLLAGGDAAGARRAFDALTAQWPAQPGAAFSPDQPFWLTPRLWSNLGLAHWMLGDAAAALACYQRALAERAPWVGVSGMTERAALLRGQADAEELNAIVTLERQRPSAAPIGLAALFERKGALLDRDTRAATSLRDSAALTPLRDSAATPPARAGSVLGDLFDPSGAAMRRAQQQVDQAWRAHDAELLRRQQQAVQQRAALERDRPVTDAETAARDAAVADVDRRLQAIGRESAQRAEGRPMMERLMQQLREGKIDDLVADPESDDAPEIAVARATQQHVDRAMAQRAALPPAVRGAIPPGAVLVEMLAYRPVAPPPDLRAAETAPLRYAAYVVRRDADTRFVDLGPAGEIDAAIGELRRAVAAPTSLERARETGRRLHALVVQPLRGALGGATNLLIAPEGLLNLVPFSALVEEDGRFMVERYDINVLASGRDLLRMNGPAVRARGPATIVADPAFAAPGSAVAPDSMAVLAGATFEALPGTATEAAAIRQLLPGAVLLSGPAATKAAVQAVRGPRILHLATHGFFLDRGQRHRPVQEAMLRSGLVFAGNGVLTALEASGLDLAGTQLVVLSACETGLGAVQNGEGVFGLRRAFTVAGASTLLMSLWEVEDVATQRLMTDYYRRLVAGTGRVAALREAQLALRADPLLAHPFYWAAFIASGQATPLR